MPEFVEAEAYRRTIEPVVGGRIHRVDVRDPRLLRRGDEPAFVHGVLDGATIEAVRRIGKLVLVDLAAGHTAALAFGLRGRLLLDGRTARATGDEWRTRPAKPDHVRLVLDVDGRTIELEDQLRLATLRIDVDEDELGDDVLALDKTRLRSVLGASSSPIKSLLMNQRRIAGIGNLIADEMLYQGRIDPRRPANEIDGPDLDDLWAAIRRTRERVLARDGSHQGVLIQQGARERGEDCPRCGVEIRRMQVGGRTTCFCPVHQS